MVAVNKKGRGMKHYLIKARRKFKGTRAEGLVEFAVVVPLFFLLMFGIIDMGHLYFVQVTLENALRQAGRYAVTGAHLPDPNNPAQNLSRVDSITRVAKKAATGLDVTQILISSDLGGQWQASNTTTNLNAAGLPGDTVTISLTTHLTLFTNLLGHFYGTNDVDTFSESVTFRNERFPASQAD
jgi:Flp pilus assembly protein TadG